MAMDVHREWSLTISAGTQFVTNCEDNSNQMLQFFPIFSNHFFLPYFSTLFCEVGQNRMEKNGQKT